MTDSPKKCCSCRSLFGTTRLGRAKYMAIVLFWLPIIGLLTALVVGVLEHFLHLGPHSVLRGIFNAILVIVGITIIVINVMSMIRRLHDMNLGGWWVLLFLVPLANIGLMVAPGSRHENRFGDALGEPSKCVTIFATLGAVIQVALLTASFVGITIMNSQQAAPAKLVAPHAAQAK
jgi:uncharacterized membrane protein YhaH (DUF805 family)